MRAPPFYVQQHNGCAFGCEIRGTLSGVAKVSCRQEPAHLDPQPTGTVRALGLENWSLYRFTCPGFVVTASSVLAVHEVRTVPSAQCVS